MKKIDIQANDTDKGETSKDIVYCDKCCKSVEQVLQCEYCSCCTYQNVSDVMYNALTQFKSLYQHCIYKM